MPAINQKKDGNFEIEIGLPEGKEWSAKHLVDIKAFIKKESQKRTPEQRLMTSLYAIKYKMEAYVDNNAVGTHQINSIEVFLNAYLKVLNLSFKKFATSIDSTDGNLKKYLSGERKFNTDLAMKFGCFFHTPPDLWLRICTKNELLLLNKEKTQVRKYKKYDYKKVVDLATA
jgi:antitoxin HigA-1